ncbi:uncharacterized protein K02A2.6-like [Uloborus diversus]|uniref:uncharacterized protein K02A2.6-like n=1 Tax=Uloborus diversus TaxID=327109 RepID=UPI0024090351|nr:uncharacterized protein K02A2.6-like [Uloborus diversus]
MSKLGLIGTLHEFEAEHDDINLYVEQLEHFFLANDVVEDKKVSVFISVIGIKTYKVLRNLLLPKSPGDCKYHELTSILKQHFKPSPILIAERFRFHRRNQLTGESVSRYLVELRRLASTCDFGSFLDEALRDRFVCGLCNENIQKRLLAKKNLKLSDAVETAVAIEIAESDAANMKTFTPAVNKVRKTEHVNANKNPQPRMISAANTNGKKNLKCYRCGATHDFAKCKYKNAKCHSCGKIGHISPVCRSRGSAAKKVEVVESESELSLYAVKSVNQVSGNKKYIIPVTINGKSLDMELDTAADVSITSEVWVKNNLPNSKILTSSTRLKDYNGKEIPVVGEILVEVKCDNQCEMLPLVIVKGDGASLFGKNWLSIFKLNWSEIFSVSFKSESCVEALKGKYKDIFQVNDKPIKHFKAVLKMKDDFQPIFCKARPVPYAVKKAVSDEIRLLEQRGIWKFVEHSRWATPLVVVPKKNGTVRLCGDYKVSVNKMLDANQYPLPTQQDLFATLRGGKFFTKLDLTHAYQQIELDDASQELLTLNTHLGLVRPTRLQYGITSASAMFQSIIEQILQGFPSVICFQDDILISSTTKVEHFRLLEQVLQQFLKYNVHLNGDKCVFMQTKVEFLGHIIDEFGIHPTEEKVSAIKNIKTPQNVTELKSFLGLLNYYAKFIKNSSTLLSPLYELLNKDVPWIWSKQCQETFLKCKSLLTSKTVLAHYDERLPLQLSCDASPVGLGAVLSHIVEGEERPVAYASRTLTKAESNYSQTEKEALAIVYGCKKFHQYLFGRTFVLVTDHQPLLTIFAPDKSIPAMSAARLQRWALLLSSFKYTIKYKKGILHQNADALSRLPDENIETDMYPSDIFRVSYVDELPLMSDDIARATRVDKVLGVILKYVQSGFPESTDNPELKPFFNRRDELSCDKNCLLWGMRVVIPSVYRSRVLDLLHGTHQGTTKMKAIARSHVWWPNLDKDIEGISSQCLACQKTARDPPASPLQPWRWPKAPWHRVHIDFAQKYQSNYLIVVDSFSKWIEVIKMSSTVSSSTIAALQQLFSRYGFPLEIVSDNGPQFISHEFSQFLKSVGVVHTLIPAYHPKSNGLAERSVQTFKYALDKMSADRNDNSSIGNKIQRFLLMYRSTPHSTTGKSPAELFLGRHIRTTLHLLHPCTSSHVEKKQVEQKFYHDRSHSRNSSFSPNQIVWVRSHRSKQKWTQGTLVKPKGFNTWVVNIDGKFFLAHNEQIRPSSVIDTDSSIVEDDMHKELSDYDEIKPSNDIIQDSQPINISNDTPCLDNNSSFSDNLSSSNDNVPDCSTSSPIFDNNVNPECIVQDNVTNMPNENVDVKIPVRRYPLRNRKKPDRLGF